MTGSIISAAGITVEAGNRGDSLAPVFVWNPEGFDPRDHLTPELHRHADCARYIVHLIHWRRVFDRRFRDGFVTLMAKYLRPYFPGNHIYKTMRDQLIEKGVLDCDNHYIKGVESMGYKLGEALSGRRHHEVILSNRTLVRKIRENRQDFVRTPEGVHRHLLEHLQGLEIDHESAMEWLRSTGDFDACNETSSVLIRDRKFFFHVCDYGRVHSNLTNLRSELRGFLTHRGRQLANLDIRNSQPVLFAAVLAERFGGRGSMPPDARLYVELCEEGRFYDHLMAEAGIPPDERSEFKKKFFAHVFFCENQPETRAARAFGLAFPAVYEVIREMKRPKFQQLAWSLQRAESDLMIGRVAVRCMKELPGTPILTIHDSIVTTTDKAEAVQAIMKAEFGAISLRPTIQPEPLMPPLRQRPGDASAADASTALECDTVSLWTAAK